MPRALLAVLLPAVLAAAAGPRAQGVLGRVVDPRGRPAAGARVCLVEEDTDVFMGIARSRLGVVRAPLARGRTDRHGRFALALPRVAASAYELHVLGRGFADHRTAGLSIPSGAWLDLGTVRVAPGVRIKGRVVDASGRPAPGAVVSVTTPGLGLGAPPGREEGLVTEADAAGRYRIENAPAGEATVAALAPGCARVEKIVTLERGAERRIDFALGEGHEIAGIVTDVSGRPIPNALVEATLIGRASPRGGKARADEAGRFRLLGLVDGVHLVSATAPDHFGQDSKVRAGLRRLEFSLQPRVPARVHVQGEDGAPLRSYRLKVWDHFRGWLCQEAYFHTVARHPGRDHATDIGGLGAGEYVVQVEAAGYARSFSRPFSIEPGGEPPVVRVRMSRGGAIEGIVTDAKGRPLAGAVVHTRSGDDLWGFGPRDPRLTRTSAVTDASGRYRLALLGPNAYELAFGAAEHCLEQRRGIPVETGGTTMVPAVKMDRLTAVSGTVRVDGRRRGRVRVSVSGVRGDTTFGFSVEVFTDDEGNFALDRGLPPGRYQVMVAREDLESPLLQIEEYARTKREVVVRRGQDRLRLDIRFAGR